MNVPEVSTSAGLVVLFEGFAEICAFENAKVAKTNPCERKSIALEADFDSHGLHSYEVLVGVHFRPQLRTKRERTLPRADRRERRVGSVTGREGEWRGRRR